jgi:coiled-coil domain-containing protein 115
MELDRQTHIDSLLEKYLFLLDEYTSLRLQLSNLQASTYQNIARANFTAERGLRYGQDHYDQRMQSARSLRIAKRVEDGKDSLVFAVVPLARVPSMEDDPEATLVRDISQDTAQETGSERPGEHTGERETAQSRKQSKSSSHSDPLRWFGLFAPAPLRNAQSSSIEMVERILPRLATVNVEMLNLEIEVRRARKKRAKAENATTSKESINSHEKPVVVDAAAPAPSGSFANHPVAKG